LFEWIVVLSNAAGHRQRAAQGLATTAGFHARAEHIATGCEIDGCRRVEHVHVEDALAHLADHQRAATCLSMQVERIEDVVVHLARTDIPEVKVGALTLLEYPGIDDQVHFQLVGERPQQLAHIGIEHADADHAVLQRVIDRGHGRGVGGALE